MGNYQIITKRGVALSGIICDIDCARLFLERYNVAREAVKRRNIARQTAWSKGYNAASTADERAAWLSHKPHKERVPAEAMLVGCMV